MLSLGPSLKDLGAQGAGRQQTQRRTVARSGPPSTVLSRNCDWFTFRRYHGSINTYVVLSEQNSPSVFRRHYNGCRGCGSTPDHCELQARAGKGVATEEHIQLEEEI